ncbi:MAG: DegT/DnrJ/EryC1/StrS family aminotransferase [Planctomycetes bacterium]|nr:DegT/DnrJ/EryC1/StrS family aminotransferase [Planctomycetota bacterium]
MHVPFIDLAAQFAEIDSEIRSAIDRVFASSQFSSGPAVEEFESSFAKYCESEHCVAVSSGTAALEILLRAYGIGPGDEVILPANTFVAAAEAIALVGARPVFVDVCADTAQVDAKQLESALTSNTKAITIVHLYGQPGEIAPILESANRRGIVVIEDGSQAHGARYKGRRVGNLTAAAAFSFYPTKNLGAYGEAGCITTNDPDIAKQARMLRDHGSGRKKYHDLIGRNDRMDEIQGAVLNVKLSHLDRWNQQRREIADMYRSALSPHADIRPFLKVPDCESVYHLFVVRVPMRDRIREVLFANGIQTGIHYPIPLHLQPAFQYLGHGEGDFPVSELLAGEILSLPFYPQMPSDQIQFVVSTLSETVDQLSRNR